MRVNVIKPTTRNVIATIPVVSIALSELISIPPVYIMIPRSPKETKHVIHHGNFIHWFDGGDDEGGDDDGDGEGGDDGGDGEGGDDEGDEDGDDEGEGGDDDGDEDGDDEDGEVVCTITLPIFFC